MNTLSDRLEGRPKDNLRENRARQGSQPSAGDSCFSRLFSWVPVRSLGERHRERMSAHLRQLDERDRYLRFGHIASDEHMERYVASIDFDRDEVFGIFNRRLQLVGFAHLAYRPSPEPGRSLNGAEFGVSVLKHARGRGFGAHLFEHAILHARNRGVDTLFIHALSENAAMLRLAQRAGAVVHRDGSESQASLKLPAETMTSRMGEWIEDSAGELDYRFKAHMQRVEQLIEVLAEPKASADETGGL